MEPVSSAQSSVTHTYPRPGSYTAKLSLRNFIGEESERTVNVQLEPDAPEDPAVVAFEAVPVTPDSYAPATFRLTTKVKNVDWCVYDFGDELPMLTATVSGDQVRIELAETKLQALKPNDR